MLVANRRQHLSILSSFPLSQHDRRGQQQRVGRNALLQGQELIHIPLRPHEFAGKKLRLVAGEPDGKVGGKFDCSQGLAAAKF